MAISRRGFLLGASAAALATSLPAPPLVLHTTIPAGEVYGVSPGMAALAEIRAANAKLTADLMAFGRAAWIEHGDGRVEVLGPTDLYLPA